MISSTQGKGSANRTRNWGEFRDTFDGIDFRKKSCSTCLRAPKEEPLCYVTGVPMEISADYVCDKWEPQKEPDGKVQSN